MGPVCAPADRRPGGVRARAGAGRGRLGRAAGRAAAGARAARRAAGSRAAERAQPGREHPRARAGTTTSPPELQLPPAGAPARAQARQEHELSFRLAEDPERLDADLEALFRAARGALERARGRARSRTTGAPPSTATSPAARCERGWLRLWLLELDGAVAAAWYGLALRPARALLPGRARPGAGAARRRLRAARPQRARGVRGRHARVRLPARRRGLQGPLHRRRHRRHDAGRPAAARSGARPSRWRRACRSVLASRLR